MENKTLAPRPEEALTLAQIIQDMSDELHDVKHRSLRLAVVIAKWRSGLAALLASQETLHQAQNTSMADESLPPSLAASLALFREDPDAWHAEWHRVQVFKVELIQKWEAADAARRTAEQERDAYARIHRLQAAKGIVK